MEAITIAFINQKGGCGKSSTCFHLSGYLASRNRNVLLVDADPQGSLSQGFLGSSAIESLSASETLAALFDMDIEPPTPATLPVLTPIERIAIVRANQTLAQFNIPSPETSGMNQFALGVFLDEIRELDLFDFVLIDCPPNLYQCSWNALLASDFVVIPVPPEDFGTQGLRVVHQAIEHARQLNPKLRLLGHLISRVDSRLLLHKSYEEKLRQLYGELVFDEVIPEASAFKVALACRKPVTQYSPSSRASVHIELVAQEIVRRIQDEVESRRVA